MKTERAETIALMALAWLLADDELCGVFMGATGAEPAMLARAATDTAFQAAVLEFLTREDRWVMAFCDSHGLAYQDPLGALRSLPGATEMHWT